MPAPFLSAKLTGVTEIEQSITSMIQKQQNTAIPKVLNDAADLGVRIGKAKAHVITGKMKANIGKRQIAKNSVEVHSLVEYAGFENARKGSKGALGSHNYFDQSRAEVAKQFPRLLTTAIEKNIRENKARTPTK